MTPIIFQFVENQKQNPNDHIQLSELIADRISEYGFCNEEKVYLGLDSTLQADYLIGLRWIDLPISNKNNHERGVIWVRPKHERILFDNLLGRCLLHPIVRNHLSSCYQVYPEEPLIPTPEGMTEILGPLIITDFLFRISAITRKGLKRRFVRRSDLMHSRVKGKIVVSATIRAQQKRSSVIDTVCTYETHTVDCSENQILKAALYQAQKYVNHYLGNRNDLRRLIAENLFAFEEVTLKSVDQTDLRDIKHSPLFAEYKDAIRIAVIILRWMGMSIESDMSEINTSIPPFWINMPELFERYCEVLLRSQYPDTKAGYDYTGYSETRLGKTKMRPDFLIPSQNRIVDAKYKYWIEGGRDIDAYRQISLYARHKKVHEILGRDHDRAPTLQLVYPSDNGSDTIDFTAAVNEADDEFDDIWIYPVRISNI